MRLASLNDIIKFIGYIFHQYDLKLITNIKKKSNDGKYSFKEKKRK